MRKLRKKGLVLSAAAGLVCAILMTAVLCLPFAAAESRGILPVDTTELWAVLSAGLAVFAATITVVRIRRRQAMPTAGIIAGGYLMLSALLCAANGSGAAFGPWLLRLSCGVLMGGLLGSLMSIRQNTHKKKR